MLLLAIGVGVIWLAGGSGSGAPAIGGAPPPTPTPRSLAFLRETPAPDAIESSGNAAAPGNLPSNAAAPAATAPALMSASDAAETTGFESGASGAIFSAPDGAAFADVASGSWQASAAGLRNDGESADAEPLLTLAVVPRASFAIEAEIRVNGVLDAFCGQSFGLAGGDAEAGRFYGGGILFPCEGEEPQARLTDVSAWEDGYHADPLIAENRLDPGNVWRTYRFELRGDAVRLIVDGVGIVSGSLDTPLDGAAAATAGIWSQGVDLEIRRIDVLPLPDA